MDLRVKFLIDNWPLILLACVSGTMLILHTRKGSVGSSSVGTGEAVRLINREKGVLVDVSEPAEYLQGHPSGARNVPLAQLESSKDMPSNKSLPIILVCATGSRSSRGATSLKKAGYERVVTLAGGRKAWQDANLPMASKAA